VTTMSRDSALNHPVALGATSLATMLRTALTPVFP
jgi:hypothetical protein